jgi:subtilisin family serine protease
METVLARLRSDARVLAAAPDVLMAPQLATRVDAGLSDDAWRWELTPAGGNWGMELVRAPQLWNLNEGVRKAMTKGGRVAPLSGVLDVGFPDAHADLAYELNMTPGRSDDHGAHVAGTMAARFDNGVGVDGIDPFARLVVRAPIFAVGGIGSVVERRASMGEFMLFGLENLVRARPAVRVVNMSLGYNWGKLRIPGSDPTVQRLVTAQGALFVEVLRTLLAEYGRAPVIVSAAGNDANDGMGLQEARWASPANNAGLVHGAAPVIVVEALEHGGGAGQRAPYSNVRGHLFAPGSG